MKSRRGRIIAIVAAVLVIAMILHVGRVYGCYPKMAPWEKDIIINELDIADGTSEFHFWYEDNGFVEEPGATRYIGTYGDCYAFLILGFNTNSIMEPYEGPVEIYGLSRLVYYPVKAYIGLYHIKRSFPRYGGEIELRAWYLERLSPETRREWMSDWQLERLTRDVEKLAEQYS